MNNVANKLNQCYASVRSKTNFKPQIALVLGSGLGDYADSIQVESVLPYGEIEGFPQSTVEGHKGQFVFGYIEKIPVVIMQGRVHYYEGYDIKDVVLPARLMGKLGAKVLFLTNASGSVNVDYQAGDFMLITDHITCMVPSPLVGPNLDELGPRFPDMSNVYDPELCNAIRTSAKKLEIPLREGTYIQTSGPNFETPQEIRAYRMMGADAVGMSTACEAMAACHMGMKVCGIASITNLGSGIAEQPLTHTEVYETAQRTAPLFKALVTASVQEIAKTL